MTNTAILAFIALLALPALAMTPAQAEPERVTVQHILIAFKGSLPGDQKVTRSMADAEALAMRIFVRAQAGEDFAAMVKTYTNDSYPGIYKVTNAGVTPDKSKNEYLQVKIGRCAESFSTIILWRGGWNCAAGQG